jgi:5-dehydro-2-deoxygluconokinase
MSSAHPVEDRTPFEVITFGRSGVDIYPQQIGIGLEDVQTFGKYLGGTTANVAVAAARLGRRAAIITGVGQDPFGRYVRRQLRELGVDDRFVVTSTEYPTPVTFCEIFPPDHFPLYFYRRPSAPDMQVRPADIDFDAVRAAQVMWLSVTGLSEEPSRESHHAVLEARARKPFTVLDLDYRPMFWADAAAAREQVQRALPHVTVALGNREECEVATGEGEPERAADALLAAGVELAIVKGGPRGVLAKTRSSRATAEPIPIKPLNGLGAGDSFGGALCHGLLAGWPLERTLATANAAGAIVASRLECSTAMPTEAEIETLLAGGDPNERLAAELASVFQQGGTTPLERSAIDHPVGRR